MGLAPMTDQFIMLAALATELRGLGAFASATRCPKTERGYGDEGIIISREAGSKAPS